jgi:arabinoxylan arabinofuranohydrolase
MNRLTILLGIIICISLTLFGSDFETSAQNPFITEHLSADPAAHVFQSRVYVYPAHDVQGSSWFDMVDYHVYSSHDLRQWTDHGVVFNIRQASNWAKKWLWGPDCAFRNNTYYLYFPASTRTDSSKTRPQPNDFMIGVATSKSPSGPFVHSKNYPMYFTENGNYPCVFIDTDGHAYMFFGGKGHGNMNNPKWGRLRSDMLEFDAYPQDITGLPNWYESCWVFKRKNMYYLTYSTGDLAGKGSRIHYATSSRISGPWTYRGEVLSAVNNTDWNQQSFVEYPIGSDNWYIFYHSSEISGGKLNERAICADRVYFNSNGTMKKVTQTRNGLGTIAYSKLKAQFYNSQRGTSLEPVTGGAGQCVNWIENGDWITFDSVDFGPAHTCGAFQATVASPYGQDRNAKIQVLANGVVVGELSVPKTGGWQSWQTVTANLSGANKLTGVKQIQLRFTGKSGSLFNLDSFRFIRNSYYKPLPIGLEVAFKSKHTGKYWSYTQYGDFINPIVVDKTQAASSDRFTIYSAANLELESYPKVAIMSVVNGQLLNYNPNIINESIRPYGSTINSNTTWIWQSNSDGTISLFNMRSYGWLTTAQDKNNYGQPVNGTKAWLIYPSSVGVSDPEKYYVEVSDAPIGCTVAFKAVANNRYWCYGYQPDSSTPEVIANSEASTNSRSRFIVEDAGNGFVALRSLYKNQYLRAEGTWGQLKVNGGTTIDSNNERFLWINNGDGTISLNRIGTSGSNCYFSADSNFNSARRSSWPSVYSLRTSIGNTEKFYCQIQ